MALEYHFSGAIGIFGYRYFDCIQRKQFFYQFRPFDETDGSAIEVVFIAHIINLFQFLDAIEIEMIDEFVRIGTVLVNDGKSRLFFVIRKGFLKFYQNNFYFCLINHVKPYIYEQENATIPFFVGLADPNGRYCPKPYGDG